MQDMIDAAMLALTDCLGLRRQEQLLVVCDPPCYDVGRAFWEAGKERAREAVMVMIAPRKQSGNEPPQPIDQWFGQFDVAVMPTSKSLSHTQARRLATEKGTRVATLPGITAEMFLRTMNTDWRRLGVYTRRIAARLGATREVRIVTELGTDLRFETGGRAAHADDGRLATKGSFGNLPAGEAYMAPLENTAEGVLVIDGSFPLVSGPLVNPLTLKISGGRVTKVYDHDCADELEKLFTKYRQPARNIAEFGVGTLESARVSGNTLEDEKVRGTVHVAIGDNASMGGAVRVPIHLDGVVTRPTVYLDGTIWIRDGELV